MTYYKYAERQVANQIDWSVVGRDITQTLDEEAKLREKKKSDIDEASRQFGRVLNEAPMGENQGVNQWTLDYASSAQQSMLTLDRELKAGRMDLRDYTKKRQALYDGTGSAFELISGYQGEYQKKLEAYNKGELSYQTVWQMGLLEGLSNFSETSLYINPTDYSVTVGKKVLNEKTGMYELSKNPSDFQSVTALKNRLKSSNPKFNVIPALEQGVQALGKEVDVLRRGGVLSVQDITRRKDFGVNEKEAISLYERAEDRFLESLMVDPNQVASILADTYKMNPDTQEPWDFTVNPEEAKKDPNKILMVADPANPSSGRLVPKLSEKQTGYAKQAMRDQFREMLDRVETPMPVFAPQQPSDPQWKYKLGQQEKQEDEMATMIGQLYWGNQQEVDAAETYFGGLNKSIKKVERTPTGIKLIYEDNNTSVIPMVGQGGKPISQEDFIKSATELTGGIDVTKALERGSYRKGATKSNVTSTYERRRQTQPFEKTFVPGKEATEKEFVPLTSRLEKMKSTGSRVWNSDVRDRTNQVREIFSSFPEISTTFKFTPVFDGKEKVIMETPNKTYEFVIEPKQAGLIKFQEQIRQVWNELAEQANSGGQQQPQPKEEEGEGSTSQMTAEEWNAAWARLGKGQSMTGLDGKTYVKK